MEKKGKNIAIIGAGVIGTALGNILAAKPSLAVTLHSIEHDIVDEITQKHINSRYFPTLRLNERLAATSGNSVLESAGLIFLAIPSVVLVDYMETIRSSIKPETLLVNLSKGFGCGNRTVCECIEEKFPNPVCTLKGPSFAREIINLVPTAFTLGYRSEKHRGQVADVFNDTSIFLDYSTDIKGVEILSILKNMYAIVMGVIDAQFDSPNLRFMVLTKAFREMRRILHHYGGQEDTLFAYCGYGDFTLTSLNDLSRNRTLGLLIGKGFFTEQVSDELVLEGKTAVEIFYRELSEKIDVAKEFPIVSELQSLFSGEHKVSAFVKNIINVNEP
jgi:glycerol-3-phosphate dehydrogenase (NAD(P)+)